MNQKLDRPLLIALVAVGVIVVAAVAVVAFGSGPIELDLASPEGVVQRYVRAVVDGDTDEALELRTAYDDECTPRIEVGHQESVRVTLDSVEIDGDEAIVDVVITTSGGDPPFDSYQWTEQARFELRNIDGSWRVDLAPWRFELCPPEFHR